MVVAELVREEYPQTILAPELGELTHSPERYELVPIGGRIKMARQPLEPLYQLAQPFISSGLPEGALSVARAFKEARDNVRGAAKRSFFPATTEELKALLRSSPAFYRPVLKTDQGPAGMFAGFRIINDENSNHHKFRVASAGGLAIPELFFLNQLEQAGIDMSILAEVQGTFRQGDETEARLALERLAIKCEENGIDLTRRASVGRGPLFFIRPAISEDGNIQIPLSTAERINKVVAQLVGKIEAQAHIAKELVRRGVPIEQAIDEARKYDTLPEIPPSSILYFQPDIILRQDGSFVVDDINIPDLGFFLLQVDPQGIDAFSTIQNTVGEVGTVVFDRLLREFIESGKSEVTLVTRNEVIDNLEDMLELLELKTLSSYFEQRGIKVNISRLADVVNLTKDQLVMLLNVDPKSADFNQLLLKSAAGELTCYPDPFVLLFKDEVHTYPEVRLSSIQVNQLRAVVSPIDYSSGVGAYRQQMALEALLERLGFQDEDIFYFTDGSGRIAPAFRYDLRGFVHALNDFDVSNGIRLRGLDFKPDNAKISSEFGSHLAAFRFMCVKK